MSPSVLYTLLWLWVVDPERARAAQPGPGPRARPRAARPAQQPSALVIILANGFIGASLGMIIFTAAIRGIPEHLFYAARVDGAGTLAIVRLITLPALRWPISFVTIYQTLSLLVSFEYILLITNGGPFYDTTVYALYVYRRAFENGQYAYGAALALFLIVIGVVAALVLWRFFDMRTPAAAAADRGALMAATRSSAPAAGACPCRLGERSREVRGAARSPVNRSLCVPDARLGADHPALFLAGHDRLFGAHRRRRPRSCGPPAR